MNERAERPAGNRAPAGAAVLQEDVTRAIRDAVLAVLAESGYGRMSIEAVARRAGVGKTAVYRRWASKREMVVQVVSAVAVQAAVIPDTGTLHGDVTAFLDVTAQGLRQPLASRIVPDLLAEAARDAELAEALTTTVRDSRRAKAVAIVRRAIERGELPESVDVPMALDLLPAPLYWHLTVVRGEVDEDYLRRLATAIIAAIAATAAEPA
jgi:AcrR family transcriptional regulator